MKIFVGLWSRDTELAQVMSENQGTRLYWLEEAVQATQASFAKQPQNEYTGRIKSIFVAPEYLFSAERKDATDARAVSQVTCNALKRMLAEMSQKFPGMLIVPGTIIYKVDLNEFPLTNQPKKERAVERLGLAETKPKEFPVAANSELTAAEKNKVIKEGQVTQLIKNRMYVFLDGTTEFSYGKRADMVEATGSDAVGGVYIPGLKAGLKRIGDIDFGFEVCFDHRNGVLKTVLGAGAPPDIHIISSAHVDNEKLNMVTRVGGFVLHASSDYKCTQIHYKAAGRQAGRLTIAPSMKALKDIPDGKASLLDEVDIGGSTLSCFSIDLQPA